MAGALEDVVDAMELKDVLDNTLLRVLRWGHLRTCVGLGRTDFKEPSGFLGSEGQGCVAGGDELELPLPTTRDHPHAGAIAPRGV